MNNVKWCQRKERTRLWFLVSKSPKEKADVERNWKRKPFHIWDLFTSSDCRLLHSQVRWWKSFNDNDDDEDDDVDDI